MTVPNGTLVHPAYFLLVGIPGLGPNTHFWLAFPLCCMYALAALGNLAIILIIRVERRLHEPMYLFLAMLSTIDLVLSSVTMPKMVSLFLTGVQEIEFNACLAQMFLIHALSAMESAVLLAMAFDRFVAICHPLRHASVLTGPIWKNHIFSLVEVHISLLLLPNQPKSSYKPSLLFSFYHLCKPSHPLVN